MQRKQRLARLSGIRQLHGKQRVDDQPADDLGLRRPRRLAQAQSRRSQAQGQRRDGGDNLKRLAVPAALNHRPRFNNLPRRHPPPRPISPRHRFAIHSRFHRAAAQRHPALAQHRRQARARRRHRRHGLPPPRRSERMRPKIHQGARLRRHRNQRLVLRLRGRRHRLVFILHSHR